MRRAAFALVLAVALLCRAPAAQTAPQVWIGPNPGSLDLLRMFEAPAEWARARRSIDVFKFTQQHTFAQPDPVTGPNTLAALTRVHAFRKLAHWRIRTALGSWAVKEFYCTPDPSGMARAVADTLSAVSAIQARGGLVHYLAMDEPFLAGQSPACGGPDLEPTADRLAAYVTGVRRAYPRVRIGLIEAYPSFGVEAFDAMLRLMRARGIDPAFVHLDVDLQAVRPIEALAGDVRRLQEICRARRIPFGIIVWGYNGDADALFARDAHRLAMALKQAYPDQGAMPDHFLLESWSASSTGQLITPSNLPEDRPYTLTSLLVPLLRRFRAEASPTIGSAGPR